MLLILLNKLPQGYEQYDINQRSRKGLFIFTSKFHHHSMRIITTIIFILFFNNIYGQATDSSLTITHLTGDFYIYTTYNTYKDSKVPANGLYFITNKGVVLFDTPWDTAQFQPLLDSIQNRHHTPVMLCISTHFHDDRSAGLEYYRQKGIRTYTTALTDSLSKARGKKRAAYLIKKDTVFTVGQYSFQTYYPGHGHTADNIVLWFPKQKILYGGCLIKSTEDDDLGYLGDASVKEYANTVNKVYKKCRNPQYVIPGHGDWTSVKSLTHTLKMAQQLRKKKQ